MKYVTYLTIYSGDKLPKFYIGSTSEQKILSNKYFGSVKSKKWKNIFKYELENNKHLFSVNILSYHETRTEALTEELRIQVLNNVVKSSDYFNESLACPNGFFGRNTLGSNNPFFGKEHSEEFKKRQSESKIGKETWMKGKSFLNESKVKSSNNHKSKYRNFSKILNGTVVKTWNRPFELKQENPDYYYTNIIKCCKGEISQAYGFSWTCEITK